MKAGFPAKNHRWIDYHRAGRELELQVEGLTTFKEIALALGIKNRQTAYNECCVALGKIALRLRAATKDHVPLRKLVQRTNPGGATKHPQDRACRRCGCTQATACLDARLLQSCCWVERDLCSACLTAPEFKRFMASHKQPSLGKP
jgi:hypothetical protein